MYTHTHIETHDFISFIFLLSVVVVVVVVYICVKSARGDEEILQ